jgi:phosphoserine phosphatase RsbU/P
VNHEVHATSLPDRYATLFYGVFDEATRTLQYINADHNPPMVIRRDRLVVRLESGGPPVGMFPNWTHEEGAVQFDTGDLVVAYTDGVTEIVNPAGEEWGRRRSTESSNRTSRTRADEMVAGIFRSMDEFSPGRQTDDATVIVLRCVKFFAKQASS